MEKKGKKIDVIIIITAVISAIFLARAILTGSKAIFDSVLVLVLLFVLYRYKKNFNLSTLTVFLASIFFFFHLLGAHGLYDFYFYGSLGYDKILHFYGPFVLFMLVFDYLEAKKLKASAGHLVFFAVLITLGINAFQEVAEFTGNSLFGSGEGVFFYGSGDLGGNDTPRDLVANFLGVTLSGVIMYFRKRK